jgi:hypothetical protein
MNLFNELISRQRDTEKFQRDHVGFILCRMKDEIIHTQGWKYREYEKINNESRRCEHFTRTVSVYLPYKDGQEIIQIYIEELNKELIDSVIICKRAYNFGKSDYLESQPDAYETWYIELKLTKK